MLVEKSLNIFDFKDLELDQQDIVSLIKSELSSKGYLVIRNFRVPLNDIEECKKVLLNLTANLGTPISHDANGALVWDIKSRDTSNGGVITYSEHSHEAELHTDSQYSKEPEHAFGLLTLKKASCGGGESFLLSLNDILQELRALPDGEQIERVLRETDYPFIVPRVFKKTNEDIEFNFGPILSDGIIRFRVDTLEKALAARPDFCSADQIFAYNELKQIILNSSSISRFFLQERDLIFINNRTMLHGRSEFNDKDRHLLRVRFLLN